jgi:class 3 adenylate cyclase
VLNQKLEKNQSSQELSKGTSAELEISPAASVERQLDARGNGHADARSVNDLGERRHLTVLFCDLVNSTSLAAQLDPEDWREIVANYHRSVAHEVERFGGHVAQYLGDGVIAYFGWPEAHDDDVERAVRAGLAVLEAIWKFNTDPSQSRLAARVGIDSGVVVIGDGTGKGADVYGEAPNMAARVQAAAEPGTLLITEAAHRLIPGVFVVEECGAQILKGIPDPVLLYRVIRPSGKRGRLAAAAMRGLTPFVGREDELRLLMDRWERSVDGEGQAVLIVGEAGIGKSRLVQQFREQIATYPHTWLESVAVPFFQNTPFSAFINILQQGFHWESGQSVEQKLAAVEASLANAGIKLDEGVPLLAQVLELPVGPKYPPSSLSPAEERKRLLASLAAWLFGVAKDDPLVVAIEDLHWADPSTLELIRLLVEQGPASGLLLLYTARPEFQPSWVLRAHHTQITLNRLSSREAREMIARVAAGNSLGADAVNTMIERTSGVPLFIEELTRAVLESGDAKLSDREIPVTLHDSLMARMDRLGPAKDVLQIGAVIGSEFSYELLHRVHSLADEEFQKALHALADAELLYVRGIAPDATYQFKHALIRDAAYEALLKSCRKDLHRLIAQTIRENFPALKDAQPEVLARHWAEAGENEQAITEWSQAGRAAEAHNAFIEAEESFRQALAQLNLLPESRERDLRELKLRLSHFPMLNLTRGWGALETSEADARIRLLAEKSDRLKWLASSMIGRSFHAIIAADFATSAALADEALELVQREGSAGTRAYLQHLKLCVLYFRGEFGAYEQLFASSREFFDAPDFRHDPQGAPIALFAHASWNAWELGRPDVARLRLAEMNAAVNPANPQHLMLSGRYRASFHALAREYEAAEVCAAEALELREKYHLPNAPDTICFLGYARAQLGGTTDGIAQIGQGIDETVRTGGRLGVPFCMMLLAAAQNSAGAIKDGLETVERALNFNPQELVSRPEALGIRGELRLKQGHQELAETDFGDSIAMARSMGAKVCELRTTMSWARLLLDSPRRDEARAMLAGIYNWFTEGFDTVDLKDASALLEELGGSDAHSASN